MAIPPILQSFFIRVIRGKPFGFRSRRSRAMSAIPAIFLSPPPTPYVHPFPPKVTQSTQESAEGRNPKTQTPGLKRPDVKNKNCHGAQSLPLSVLSGRPLLLHSLWP